MRVLQLVKTSVGAKWAQLQMAELVKRGIEVHVALPPGGPRIPGYKDTGVVVHEQQYPMRPLEMLRSGRDLRRLVRKLQPDILHSWFTQTTLYARTFARDFRGPRVFQVPGPLHLEQPIYRYADRLSATRRDIWVGTSRYICDFYRRMGVPEERLRLSYVPVDLSFYQKLEPGYLRGRFPIPATKKIIGMVSYIYPPHRLTMRRRGVKGHEDLIDSFTLLRQRRSDVTLVIVGSAWGDAEWYERQIHEYARERCGDDIIFTGFEEDVRKVFADFDVFVHPSHSENLGGVFESLLLEVPTVASKVGGIPEAVLPDETGYLVDPYDHEEVAAAIESVLDDPEHSAQLARRGRRHILELMDLDNAVDQVVALYREAVA